VGTAEGSFANDLQVLERAKDQLSLEHRIDRITACVDNGETQSGALNSIQFTAGNYSSAASEINLNTFGNMVGTCDTFNVPEGVQIVKLEMAYDASAVTAIQIGLSNNVEKLFGFVGLGAGIVRFSFTPEQPLIGLSGYYTTYPKALRPVTVRTTCDWNLDEISALKAMWTVSRANDIRSLIREQWAEYSEEQESQGNHEHQYGLSTYQSQVERTIYADCSQSELDAHLWYGILIMLAIDLVVLIVLAIVYKLYCAKRQVIKKRTEVLDEEEKQMTKQEGGEPAAVIYVYKDTVAPPLESQPHQPELTYEEEVDSKQNLIEEATMVMP